MLYFVKILFNRNSYLKNSQGKVVSSYFMSLDLLKLYHQNHFLYSYFFFDCFPLLYTFVSVLILIFNSIFYQGDKKHHCLEEKN